MYDGYEIVPSHQIPGSAVIGQKLQRLEIGNGMIQPGAVQRAVKEELPVAQLQPLAGGEHGIRIVLFHRKHLCLGGDVAQRVKIPDDAVRRAPQLFKMAQTAVCRHQVIIRPDGQCRLIEPGGAENQKLPHTTLQRYVFSMLPHFCQSEKPRLSHEPMKS